MRLMMLSRGTARLLAALANALPSITDLLMFTLLIVLLASVMGRDVFAGRLERFGEMRYGEEGDAVATGTVTGNASTRIDMDTDTDTDTDTV